MTLKERYMALPHLRQIFIWVLAGVLLLLLVIYGGGYLRDKWDQHRYEAARAADAKKATAAEALAQQAIGEAQRAIKDKQEALQQAAEIQKQLDLALQALNDSTKTAQQKREIYNSIKDRTAPVIVTPDNSIGELCKRAAEAGIKCEQ